ncbi:MAG: hypothetical protein J6Y36_06610 [Treponema sp.]|nr:hypothetical protein [Treponema sp.]
MANNKRILFLFCILLVTGFGRTFLSAQSSGKIFTQKLEWEEDKNAYEYEVEITKSGEDSVKKKIKTRDNFVEFSMKAGEYKYRVKVYDFLGRMASVTDWKDFTITKAVAPDISLVNDTLEIPRKKARELVVPIDVEKIEPEASVTFINIETNEEVEGKLDVETDEEGNVKSSKAVFPGAVSGQWKVVVTNPSGLSSESEPISVENAKKEPGKDRDFSIMVTGLTSVIMSGRTKENIEYGKADAANYIGFGFTIQHLPIKSGNLMLGYEGKYSYFSRMYSTESYDLGCRFNDFDIDFALRYNLLDNKFGLNAKLGFGLTLITESIHYVGSSVLTAHDPVTFGYVNVNGGVSVNWIPFKHFIMELGANLTDVLAEDENIFILVPYLSAGIRF